MKRLVLLSIVTIILAGCGGSAVPAPTATALPTNTPIPPTATPTPVPTSTPVPLSSIDLSALLIQPGDLPSGLTGGQIRDEAPGMFFNLPKAENTAYQQFQRNGETHGGVTVFLYKLNSDIEDAYRLVHSGMGETKEVKSFATNTVLTDSALVPANDLLFIECQALVHIRMSDSTDSIIAYAKRLDKRLKPIACQ